MLRWLVLPLLAQAGDAQHHDGHNVGEHFVQFLHRRVRAGRDVHVQDVESTEENRREHANIRAPDGEDDQRNRQPAAVAERVV